MKAERTHGNKRASRAAWVPLNWGVCTASTRSLAVFARLSARLRSVESVGWMAAMRLGTARECARASETDGAERKATPAALSCLRGEGTTLAPPWEKDDAGVVERDDPGVVVVML